jgi:hypothetical protein
MKIFCCALLSIFILEIGFFVLTISKYPVTMSQSQMCLVYKQK